MMNDKTFENKVNRDVDKAKKDLAALGNDGVTGLSRLGDKVNQATGKAKEDLTTWVEDSVSQLSEGFEKLTGDARETVVDAAATVKKDVGYGLSQYNAKAQDIADRVPGDFGKKAAGYPWVTITIALAIGVLLGVLLEYGRKPLRTK
jgi:ElaB/YqjD/DUF883 family membrane-anchored ribosome-binding protein